jgi:hypothetical protein
MGRESCLRGHPQLIERPDPLPEERAAHSAKAISGLRVPPAPIVVSTVGPVSKGVSVASRLLVPS